MMRPTSLYRLSDVAGRLLYVGIAGNPGRRFEQHAGDKPWWGDVSSITLEHFTTREAALAAETRAIKTERPRHNIAQALRSSGPLPPPRHRPEIDTWAFQTRYGHRWEEALVLCPEISLEPCVDNVYGTFDDPDEQGAHEVAYWRDYVRRHYLDRHQTEWPERLPIYWSVGSLKDNICETAPLPEVWSNCVPDLGDFTSHFTTPISSTTGERINWLQLPVRHDRFPEFAKALGWTPSPLQATCPFAALFGRRPTAVTRAA